MKKARHHDSYFRDVLDRLKAHRLAMVGLTILILEIFAVVFLPLILGSDPITTDPTAFGAAPSAEHWLGTDLVGRDLLARLLYGGRVSMFVGICSTVISILIGVPLGIIAGYYGGALEFTIMRFADIFMSFPAIVLILVLVSVTGPSIASVTMVIGILGWPQFARLIYGNVLSVRRKEYVESARALGTKDLEIIARYIFPNAFQPVLIAGTFRTASAIILESSLSFLGMGVRPPNASWGNLLYDARSISVLADKPYMWVPAGLAMVITVLSINFFGDGVRDALDPKMKV